MAELAKPAVSAAAPARPARREHSASDLIRQRDSKELVIALSGPIGCGMAQLLPVVTEELTRHGYQVVAIKLTSQFKRAATAAHVAIPASDAGSLAFRRYIDLQNLGNDLRKRLGDSFAAELAVHEITQERKRVHPDQSVGSIEPDRVAYIIDQLKHPAEALLLRQVYGDLFFLVGVLRGEQRRLRALEAAMTKPEAATIMTRDKGEANKLGQQLEKTLQLADFFVRNSHSNVDQLRHPISRFLDLIHGANGKTPTRVEQGMFAAYSAAVQSACLSRQVGAAVLDRDGNLLSTGCNDVPKAGGGRYTSESSPDHRCVVRDGGKCFNHQHKDLLRDEVRDLLVDAGIDPATASNLAERVRLETRLRDLIEFSRSVHAEMDAIVSLARRGGSSTSGAFLFTTTYPCHNCARHIVAAGLRAVYFIEPYDKSLAATLHDDSIESDPEADPDWSNLASAPRVTFIHFEGVAPRRFVDLFLAYEARKDVNGLALRTPAGKAAKRVAEPLDDYQKTESRVVEDLVRRGGLVLA